MNGFRMIRVRDNGDATTTYNVDIVRELLLTEFCEYVIRGNPKEWGSIYVNGNKVATYDHGRCTAEGAFYRYCCKPLKSGWANGGWGIMDYHMMVEE